MSHASIVQLTELPSVDCPCGKARRAFADRPEKVATVHLVDISTDARAHYHRGMTELYVVLEGSGEIELDGVRYPVKPLTAIYIPPGVRHRAVGRMRILNVPVPAFDPADEWEDESGLTGKESGLV